MNIIAIIIICTVIIIVLQVLILLKFKNSSNAIAPTQSLELLKQSQQQEIQHLHQSLQQFNQNQKQLLQHQTTNLIQHIQQFQVQVINQIKDSQQQQQQFYKQSITHLQELKQDIGLHLSQLRQDNAYQLDQMRITVDEKLQKTLNNRISQSFEIVQKQLQSVQEGLGAMQNIANDVGGLKKVLNNVKLRGGIGEIQLGMILEQFLATEQFGYQVKVNPASTAIVEYAIKLPGNTQLEHIWLPIDSKFPKDTYEHLLQAYEIGDPIQIATQQKNLEITLKKMAKDIHDKYIHPPYTTGFGILFLPFESIYAEVIRNTKLVDQLQQEYNIIVTGPNTITALLNSLQMGFKTLAIQKRSQEVWNILAGVKKEFNNFETLMQKAQNNIQTGLNQLDDLVGKRTRAIQRQLNDIDNTPLLNE